MACWDAAWSWSWLLDLLLCQVRLLAYFRRVLAGVDVRETARVTHPARRPLGTGPHAPATAETAAGQRLLPVESCVPDAPVKTAQPQPSATPGRRPLGGGGLTRPADGLGA